MLAAATATAAAERPRGGRRRGDVWGASWPGAAATVSRAGVDLSNRDRAEAVARQRYNEIGSMES